MAETISYETKKYTIHHISCDECGKHICDSKEYDDGYYEDPSGYEQTINTYYGWYVLRANLCAECRNKKNEALKKLLIDFGFEKERY